ncbi:helix-turn-helix transcriptional regulator [Stenotrophomonas maltophilia]|uniref:helix-turn-helix transcriptional regulator n=1 Tax=Stenotrophomonas maltophilia TaxID=40324 RepID=UPI003D18F86F
MDGAENNSEVPLKLEQVEVQTGTKKSYTYREMSRGNFPSSLKVGARTRWRQSEVKQRIFVGKAGSC